MIDHLDILIIHIKISLSIPLQAYIELNQCQEKINIHFIQSFNIKI